MTPPTTSVNGFYILAKESDNIHDAAKRYVSLPDT